MIFTPLKRVINLLKVKGVESFLEFQKNFQYKLLTDDLRR